MIFHSYVTLPDSKNINVLECPSLFFQVKSNIDGLDVGFYGDRMGCNKNYQPARYCTKSLSEMSDQVPYGDSTLLAKP